jgi:hypothetical protein
MRKIFAFAIADHSEDRAIAARHDIMHHLTLSEVEKWEDYDIWFHPDPDERERYFQWLRDRMPHVEFVIRHDMATDETFAEILIDDETHATDYRLSWPEPLA